MNLLIVARDEADAAALRDPLATHRITAAQSAAAALSAAERDRFDAMILAGMAHPDGVAFVRRLRERGQTLPVLIVSRGGTPLETVAALDAGADDCVAKPAAAGEIDARLRALVRGRGWGSGAGDTLRAGDIVVSPARHRAWRDGRPLDLAKLEFALLAELARHAGGFVSRAALLERVWGRNAAPTTNIVEVQVRALRRKLTAHGGGDPVVTKRGVGYMLRD